MMLLEIRSFDDAIEYLAERESVRREALEVIRMQFPEREAELDAMLATGLFKLEGPDAL